MEKIAGIIKNSGQKLSLFSESSIADLENKIIDKRGSPHVICEIRNKEVNLTPEEVVRQLYLMKLIKEYGYPKDRIRVEHPIQIGSGKVRADIVVFDTNKDDDGYIIVEIKRPELQDGKAQLRSYTHATGALIAVWTNGEKISYYHRKNPNYFKEIRDIPNSDQELEDVLKGKFTLKSLMIADKIANDKKSLEDIILDMEDEVLANAGVDVFEEVFKLIFTKLYDELESRDDKIKIDVYLKQNIDPENIGNYEEVKRILHNFDDTDFRKLEFSNNGQTDIQLKDKIQKLFNKAKDQWEGVFDETSQVQLTPSHLAICVASLQNIKLFNSNLQVIDEAFEYLVNKSAKGEKGQYFTPRHVIDMCVQMLNPKRGEYMIDTAAGSCGFPVHTIFHLTGSLYENRALKKTDKDDVSKIFGIDFDGKVVRVARMLNLIAGDGNTNVLHLNNLDYRRWNEVTKDDEWRDIYGKGLKRLKKLRVNNGSYRDFNFDIVMANPPFAGDIKETQIIHEYQLGFNKQGKSKKTVGRDILFIERNLNFLKPGGRMAIVLPQGRFNNTSDEYIREYISENARILAVVDLDVNTFKPHTGAKTSVLFLQKWNNDEKLGPLCKECSDYPIFFAVSEKSGKDNSGDYVYVKDGHGRRKLDKHGHLLIDHDLHSHAGELADGIAEAFIQWAKSEKMSFFLGEL